MIYRSQHLYDFKNETNNVSIFDEHGRPRSSPQSAPGDFNVMTVEQINGHLQTSEQSKSKQHRFSPVLARRINPAQPDITSALVFRNFQLWANMPHYQLKHQATCYRSLSQIESEDLPYLSRSTIHGAIARLETALGDQFRVHRDSDKMWITIADEMRAISKNGDLRFRVSDAIAHGVTAAILLWNLDWSSQNTQLPMRDEDGVRYERLSPSILSKVNPSNNRSILPFSRSTISRTLENLVNKGILRKHPSKPNFYTRQRVDAEPQHSRVDQKKTELGSSAEVNIGSSEVDGSVSELNASVSEPDDLLRADDNKIETGRNKVNKGTDEPCSAEPEPVSISDEHRREKIKKFQEMVIQKTNLSLKKTALSRSQHNDLSKSNDDYVEADYADYEIDELFSLRYHEFINDQVEDCVDFFKEMNWKYTQTDIDSFRKLFQTVYGLESADLFDLLDRGENSVLCGDYTLPPPTKKGKFDNAFFARQIKDAQMFWNYLPHLIREVHGKGDWGDRKFILNNGYEHPYSSIIEYFARNENAVVYSELESNPNADVPLHPGLSAMPKENGGNEES